MKYITLTKRYFAKVSDHDFERINSLNWFASVGVQVRAARMQNRKMIYMQHEVLYVDSAVLARQGLEVDHEDRDTLNNQDNNLRVVTHTINMRNTQRHLLRVGVSLNKRANLWMAYLDEPDKKRKYLGYRKTKEEALALVEEARNANY